MVPVQLSTVLELAHLNSIKLDETSLDLSKFAQNKVWVRYDKVWFYVQFHAECTIAVAKSIQFHVEANPP